MPDDGAGNGIRMNLTIVVTYGRTGSTMLLHALCRHPEVLMWRAHPYEHRISQSIFAAARTGGPPPDFSPIQLHGATYLAARPDDAEILGALATSSQAAVRERPWEVVQHVYARVREHYANPAAGHIVEKGFGITLPPDIARAWPATRLIFLLR